MVKAITLKRVLGFLAYYVGLIIVSVFVAALLFGYILLKMLLRAAR
jgi:hypothetical protein